jgi:hypothetical protein
VIVVVIVVVSGHGRELAMAVFVALSPVTHGVSRRQ